MLLKSGKRHDGPQDGPYAALKKPLIDTIQKITNGTVLKRLEAIMDISHNFKEGRVTTEQARAILKETLHDDEQIIRWSTVYALGHLGTSALPDLSDALEDECVVVQSMSAAMIYSALKESEIPNRTVLNPYLDKTAEKLIGCLGSGDKSVEMYATLSLGEIAKRDPVGALKTIETCLTCDSEARNRLEIVVKIAEVVIEDAARANKA
ncbi:MAG: hypothetical protein ABH983_04905 [Candidatus Micrarchaeota archaeon]